MVSEFKKYRRGLEPGTIERHDFGSKAGDPDWCYSCGEHRNHPAHAAKDAELAKFDFEKHSLKVSLARAEAQLAEARKALEEAREVVDACAGDNRPARAWAITVRDGIDGALAALRALTGGQADG